MKCTDPRGGCRGPAISQGLLERSNTLTQSFFPHSLAKNGVFFACSHSDTGWQSSGPLPSDCPGLLLLSPFLLPSHYSIPHQVLAQGSTLSPHCSYWSRMNLQHLPQKGEPSKNKPSRSASQTRGQAGPKSISLGKAPLPVTSHSLQQPGPTSTGEKVLSNTIEQKGFLRKNQVKRMCRHQ